MDSEIGTPFFYTFLMEAQRSVYDLQFIDMASLTLESKNDVKLFEVRVLDSHITIMTANVAS